MARPRLLMAYSDSAHASRCVRQFRRLGWEVHMVASGALVQRLAIELMPDAIVIDVDLPDESGWLSAAKILLVQPSQRIILLADSFDANERERARSLGVVGMVRREDGMGDLTALVVNRQVSVAV
jgi:CheY-like chemotaxis protein